MTTPPQPTTAPFGFAPVADPGAVPAPAAAPVPDVPAAPPLALGSPVTWTEHDIYDELHPQRVRYGLVVSYDENGAAQVLPLGDARHVAHFAPATAKGGPTVADLTPLGA
jgi:hypothetical protein